MSLPIWFMVSLSRSLNRSRPQKDSKTFGQVMLDEGSVVVERNGALTACNPQAARRIQEAGSGIVAPAGEQNSVSVTLTDVAPRWLADGLPLRSGSGAAFGRDHDATAAIFVRRAEIPAASDIEIIAQLYKLMSNKIHLFQAIVNEGSSVDELAVALGIAGANVKTHINALFAKTGTSRRDDSSAKWLRTLAPFA